MKPLVWVVEDNDANFELVEYVLESCDCSILRARTVRELRTLALGDLPSLVLLDVNLPDGSGLDAVRYLRNEGGLGEVPILALTAHAMAGDRERFLSAGFTEYLPKPISPSHLGTVVRRYVGASGNTR